MSSPTPHARGAVLSGRYVVQRKLGSGSMGTVYLARDARENRLVALKVIRPDRAALGVVERLREEFRAMVSLSHPGIARVYDFGYVEGSGFPFYTSEYIEGVPLPPGPPEGQPPLEHLKPITDLLDALGYLHDHDILHLDIHAGNLIVAEDTKRGGVLIDFGLVRSLESPRLPLSAASWSVLPPEMVEQRKLSPRSDLYLAGRLLLYRLTGRTEGEARLPREIPGWGARLTLDLERILSKALQPVPAQRFASAGEFLQALRHALGEAVPTAPWTSAHGITESVGRDPELREIEAALRDVTRGKAHVLWFVADSGMGKTHILSEARVRAQLRGLDVVDVTFSELAAEPVLSRALGALESKSPKGPPWLDPFAARHGGTPAERARRVAEAFFVESEKPLVLLLDDADKADDESRELLRGLVAEAVRRQQEEVVGCGLALLVTSPGEPDDSLSRVLTRRHLRALRPLHPSSSRKLLRNALRPLRLPRKLMSAAVALGAASPFRILEIASLLRAEWGPGGVIPESAELPALPPGTRPVVPLDWERIDPVEKEILEALTALQRPAPLGEITQAVRVPRSSVQTVLRRLVESGLVTREGQGRRRVYRIACLEHSAEILGRISAEALRGIHLRMVEHLRAQRSTDPRQGEHLARHLLEAGLLREATDVALEVAHELATEVSFGRALRLLEEIAALEDPGARRLRIVERASQLLEETGDHLKGIALLEPFLRCGPDDLSARDRVRLGRLLGTHYHRAGRLDEAQQVFEEAQRIADPRRDIEDLVYTDSEMAELLLFRGAFDEAEAACRRGLERVGLLKQRGAFPGRMEVVLRASLGHLRLRSLSLDSAREELLHALELSRHHGTTAEQASILSNLAVTENQRNRFAAARQYFSEAEELFGRIGERRHVIQVATSLAVIAAKLGDREQARLEVERAAQLARHYPGKRLEFSVEYSRGIVHHMFGEVQECTSALEKALPLGREIGDRYLVAFGDVYLAEACLLAGRYRDAQRQLKRTLQQAKKEGPPVLLRIVHSRLLVVETLLGRMRSAARSERAIENTERTGVLLLEAWVDLYVAFARLLQGKGPGEWLSRAQEMFAGLDVPIGDGLARLFGLLLALGDGDEDPIRRELEEAQVPPGRNAFLAVARPLLRAEAHFRIGELDGAEKEAGLASSAIVGSPFLELDLRLELLRARTAVQRRDITEARRCLHRCLHTRDHLLELVPAGARKAFLGHPRFELLEETERRLEKHPRLHYSTAELRRSAAYEGMLGQTSVMNRLFHTIEKVSAQDIAVLIHGETGTGKELVARALHQRSPRREKPFLALHCATLPVELFESELFGYEEGAFTGAQAGHTGLLESVDGGTLLLDEVCQLPSESQAKLLQFLDKGAFRRVGGRRLQRVDVRILASSSRAVVDAVRRGAFREDLYYRLARVELTVPPLRARKGDIALLARHFLERHAQQLERAAAALRSDAVALLEEYPWPGNVRELETVLLRAQIDSGDSGVIGAADLAGTLEAEPESVFDESLLDEHDLDDLKTMLEREYLSRLFRKSRGNLDAMMRRLGLKHSQLYAWLKKLGLDVRTMRKRLRP